MKEPYGGWPPFEKNRPTSREAAHTMQPLAHNMRGRLLDWGRNQSWTGWTDEEAENALSVRHQTISARRRELYLMGDVVWVGKRRRNRSGRSACVWITASVADSFGLQIIPLPEQTTELERLRAENKALRDELHEMRVRSLPLFDRVRA